MNHYFISISSNITIRSSTIIFSHKNVTILILIILSKSCFKILDNPPKKYKRGCAPKKQSIPRPKKRRTDRSEFLNI